MVDQCICGPGEYCVACPDSGRTGVCGQSQSQYSPLANFKRWLARFQALAEPPKPIPDEVMAMGLGVSDPHDLHFVMRTSKVSGASKYLQWVPYILKRHGEKVPLLPPTTYEQLCDAFQNFSRSFVRPKGRKILPHCSFLARKILIELGEMELADRVCDIRGKPAITLSEGMWRDTGVVVRSFMDEVAIEIDMRQDPRELRIAQDLESCSAAFLSLACKSRKGEAHD